MADTKSIQTKTTETVTTEQPTTQPTQKYFLPEFNITVEAVSIEDAIAIAKKAKGSK